MKTYLKTGLITLAVSVGVILSIPFFYTLTIRYEQNKTPPAAVASDLFPVTVDPAHKLIAENPQVNAYLASPTSPLAAAVGGVADVFSQVITWIATTIDSASWYQGLASLEGRVVTITPGMRKEQVASVFATALGWNGKQQKAFLTPSATSSLPLLEGAYSPGTYLVSPGDTPNVVQKLISDRFARDVLAHYGTTTAEKVPLDQALTIASLIQRETIGTSDMRLVSGIIWNRLFAGMNLQIDSTVQYVKANVTKSGSWWPKVLVADLSRRSPYNTYLNSGLPPTPIANPSVAAVLAALNPLQTSCLFYFNDQKGNIICSDTYKQHVALLKKQYGRGK